MTLAQSLPARLLRTLVGVPFLFFYMCAMATVFIVGGESQLSEWALAHWCNQCLRVAGARVLFSSVKLDPDKSYVFVANHTSDLDIFAIITRIGRPMRFIAKKELSYVPFFGTAAARMGHVFVDRKRPRVAAEAIQRRIQRGFTEGVGLLFFAEGTRAKTAQLLPFKKGAAIAAIDTQLDVVPIGIAGAREIKPPGFTLITPGTMALCVGEPIPVRGFTLETRDAFAQAQQAAVARAVEAANQLLAADRGA